MKEKTIANLIRSLSEDAAANLIKKEVRREQFAEAKNISLRFVDYLISERVIPVRRYSRRCVRIPINEAEEALKEFQSGLVKTKLEKNPNSAK